MEESGSTEKACVWQLHRQFKWKATKLLLSTLGALIYIQIFLGL